LRAVLRALLLCLGIVAPALGAEVKPGDQAPPLGLEKVLQAPLDTQATWSAFQGRAVVLEFWATWCGPCLAALPHLNDLARKLAGQPILFLSVTDEKENVVRSFLKKKPIEGWVGLDTDRSMFDAYGAQYVPFTVLVDGNRMIRAVPEPNAVTEESLRALIAGKEPGTFMASTEQEDSEPLFQVMIRPSVSAQGMISTSADRFIATSLSAKDLLALVYGKSSSRILLEKPLPEGNFDARVFVGSRRDLRDSLLRQAVEVAFGIQSRLERRDMDVLELIGRPKPGGGIAKSAGAAAGAGYQVTRGRIEGTNLTPEEIASCVEAALRQNEADIEDEAAARPGPEGAQTKGEASPANQGGAARVKGDMGQAENDSAHGENDAAQAKSSTSSCQATWDVRSGHRSW